MKRLICVTALLMAGCGGDDGDNPVDPDAGIQQTFDAGITADAGPSQNDPLPTNDSPGEHGGTGCPDSDEATFTLALDSASSNVFSGTIADSVGDGYYYVRGDAGQEVFGYFGVDAGDFSTELPMFCGTQVVKLKWSNATCSTVVTYAVVNSGCTPPDLRVTLSWDDVGDDWELHLIKPGGRINDNATDCTWTSCIDSSPDWGVTEDASDDPSKDVDNTEAYGPENIVLSGLEAGIYTIMVEHWSSAGAPDSDGSVIINMLGQPVVVAPIEDLPYQSVWTVGTIEMPGKLITTSADIFDCSANWSNGCKAVIP